MAQTVEEIKQLLQSADAQTLAVLERSLAADTRKGVISALTRARKRIDEEAKEAQRLESLFAYQRQLIAQRGGGLAVGLDEVGRGPLAGPLAVGAVVLPEDVRIMGLNDSKQVSPELRHQISLEVKEKALAWSVVYIQPDEIDACGMTASLITAFRRAVRNIEEVLGSIDVVLLDGNPLHMDKREINVIKGDAKCASIAAASIVAKVERDNLMIEAAKTYPQYGFDKNKGYGSAEHIEAIQRYGLCPLHRRSFCTTFEQPSLF